MPHWRRKRREPTPWHQDPANPEMRVYARFLVRNALGFADRVERELTPDEMQAIARNSLANDKTNRAKPSWDRDPLYHAARRLKQRLAANQSTNQTPNQKATKP